MIILKVTKNQDFTLSLEDTFFEKTQRKGVKLNSPPPSHFKVKHSGKWKVIPMKLIVINIRKYKGKAISVFFRTYLDVSTHLHPLYASVHFMLDLPPPLLPFVRTY